MSTIKVNNITTRSGCTMTLGESGKTITIPAGATITNSGTQTGFGRTGSVDWQTSSIKTESFTAANGEGYFVNTADGTPFKNYAVTVASGTLYIVGGTGNVFNLDGSQQTAITLMKGKTYRFTQSDSSNDGHQLIISTSNSSTLGTFQAGIVSSGITYYIDGSATQSNWINSTTFNAGTTRYIEFQPSESGTFYFGCYNHGIGMGGAITCETQTINLPAGSAGNIVSIQDYNNTFNTINARILPNGSEKVNGGAGPLFLTTEGQGVTLVYIDSTIGWRSVQDNEFASIGSNYIVATGGTITECGNDKIHTFNSPGTFTVSALSPTTAENEVSYLVVGGGGAGSTSSAQPASYGGGGGGAGGFRETKSPYTPYTASPLDGQPSAPNRITVTATSYPISVGAGGSTQPYCASNSTSPGPSMDGSNTTFSSITSTGGGGGGQGAPSSPHDGRPGGSGGGAGGRTSGSGGTGNTPPTTPAQGQNGGGGTCSGATAGGGGGGATAAGTTGTSPGISGVGGAGASTQISGSAVTRAGGGGAGGGYPGGAGNATGGCGGAGGGGAGNAQNNPVAGGVAGTTNTGGGGGGGGSQYNNSVAKSGGNGGSGVVIIRYKYK